MKNNNVVNAFKAFKIKNLQKISGGIRYLAIGGGTFPDGRTYVDYQVQNDDRVPTGAYKCDILDGTNPAGGAVGAGTGTGSGSTGGNG